jgi:hypothetical protein
VMRVSKLFKRICNKVWNLSEIYSLWIDVAIILTLVEMHFPPSFFDIMMHLLYHLVDKLNLCGLVSTKWMYPMERYMKTLKTYVHNMVMPKVSMVEWYIWDECLGFITKYLQRFEVVQRRIWDVNEEEGDVIEMHEGAGAKFLMCPSLRDLAHQYVLNNISIMSPWLE